MRRTFMVLCAGYVGAQSDQSDNGLTHRVEVRAVKQLGSSCH